MSALCGVAFTACEGDDEPEYLEVTKSSASSITIEVNSDGAYGYYCGILSVANIETITSMNNDSYTSGDALTDEDIKYALGQALYTSDRQTGSTPVTFSQESTFFYGYMGGEDLAAGTTYYVGVADAYVASEATDDKEAEYNFENEDIKYVLVTTPAE